MPTRNCRLSDRVSGQRSAVSGQRSAVSSQQSAVSGQQSAVSSPGRNRMAAESVALEILGLWALGFGLRALGLGFKNVKSLFLGFAKNYPPTKYFDLGYITNW